MTAQPTTAQQFADEYARDLVPGMLRTIRNARRYSRVILVGAMATSYSHQALFLAHSGAGIFGWVLPLLFDTAMVYMLSIVKAPGMVSEAKRAAAVVFAAVALVSGFINAAAPGGLGMRALYAFVVLLVIGVEWVAGRIRPDFTAIQAQAPATASPVARKLAPEVAAARAAKAKATRERNAQDKAAEKLARQDRPARTPRRARQVAEQGELALMLDGYVPADAPVSPAPAV